MPSLLAILALAAATSQAPPAADPAAAIDVYVIPGGYMVNRVTVQSADQIVPLIAKDSDQPIQVRGCGSVTLGQLLPLINALSVEFKGRLATTVTKTPAGENGCPQQ